MTLAQLANVALLVFSIMATVMVARKRADWRLELATPTAVVQFSRTYLMLVGVAGIVGGLIGIVRSFSLTL